MNDVNLSSSNPENVNASSGRLNQQAAGQNPKNATVFVQQVQGSPFAKALIEWAQKADLSSVSHLYENGQDAAEVTEIVDKIGAFLQANAGSIKSWGDLSKKMELAGLGQSSTAYQGLLRDFAAIVGIQVDSSNRLIGGDWAPLASKKFPIDLSDPAAPNNPFIKVLNQFLSVYRPPQGSVSNKDATEHFITKFQNFISLSEPVFIQEKSAASNLEGALQNNAFPLLTYEGVYKLVTKDTSKEGFEKALGSFYDDQVKTQGYFLPSHAFADWTKTLQAQQKDGLFVEKSQTVAPTEAIAAVEEPETFGIYDIMDLLLEMVVALQELAIAQANRLNIYTDYQNAYTVLQSEIPFLSPGDVGKTSDEDMTTAINMYNQNVANKLMMDTQAYRDIQASNASKQQASLNTTTQAVNDTISQMDSFLDMLTRIRTSLFS